MKILFLSRATLYSQPGGDTLQMEQTAHYLRELGHAVEIKVSGPKVDQEAYDVIHFFNLGRPADLLSYFPLKRPLVLSAVYHDYTEYDRYHRGGALQALAQIAGPMRFEYLKTCWRGFNGSDKWPGWRYGLMGQKAAMQKIIRSCAHVFTTSQQEAAKIKNDLNENFNHSVVSLGSEHMAEVATQKREGVLCAARIEGPKNQLNLIRALRNTDIPLRLTGQTGKNQKGYGARCRALATSNITFPGRLSAEALAKEFAAAKVHVLPSYYETTGLATLEALKNSSQAVITDRGGQGEIFKDHAYFCEPDSPGSIAEAVQKALQDNTDHRPWVKENFSWERAARQISDIYQRIADQPKP